MGCAPRNRGKLSNMYWDCPVKHQVGLDKVDNAVDNADLVPGSA